MGFQYVKPWLEPAKFARNGKYPDALYQASMSELGNHIAMYRLKEIASFGMTTSVISGGTPDADKPRWRTKYEPSPYATCLIFKGWLAQAALENPASDPYAFVTFDNGTHTGTCELHYGAAAAANANPDHMAVMWGFVTNDAAPTTLLAPTSGTSYSVTVSDRQSRIAACTIFEGSLNATAPFTEGYAVTSRILSTDRSVLIPGARNMWKQQGAPLFTWTVDNQASPRTRISATSINAIDDTNTSVATSTPGYTLDLRYRDRSSASYVPVRFWVYGSSAGTGGTVLLKASNGSNVASITGITTAGWYSSTLAASFPATLAKYDLHYAGDGTNTFSFYAAALVQYAA